MANQLDTYRNQQFDLSALCDAAKDLLLASGIEPGDDRVSVYPDKRTVRYYQSLGLLEKPVRYEGRKAIYSYGHLLKIVAVKLLQAEGQSLAQVQRVVPRIHVEQLERAVSEALSMDRSKAAAKRPVTTPGRQLVSYELQPGVIVTLDPNLVANPDSVVQRLLRALSSDSN